MADIAMALRAKVDQAEALARKADYAGPSGVFVDVPDIRALLAELYRLREFSEEIREAHTFIVDHNDFDDAVTKSLEKLDARATGGDGT